MVEVVAQPGTRAAERRAAALVRAWVGRADGHGREVRGVSRELMEEFRGLLNLEVPEFRDRIPTTENVAIAIWQRLHAKLNVARLHRVRVYETPDLFVDFYGEEQ